MQKFPSGNVSSRESLFSKSISWLTRDRVAVFFLFWCLLGLTITVKDLRIYALQHSVPESIVEHHTYSLGHSKTPSFQAKGDTFLFEGQRMAAKQPGQFTLGAVVYFWLWLFDLTYLNNFDLTAALVTWFSTSLMLALAASFYFALLNQVWGVERKISFLITFAFVFGTNLFSYGGLAHHDIIAISFVLISFYFLQKNIHQFKGQHHPFALFSGILLGLGTFSSMLPSWIILSILIYVLFFRNFRLILVVGLGYIIGLLPLFIHNTYYFDNPLVQANMAGNYKDTFFHFNWWRMKNHTVHYFLWGNLSIWKYMPIMGLGFFGLFFWGRKFFRENLMIFTMVVLHSFYILNIDANGYCQYGPRFLIPLVPFISLGLIPILRPKNLRILNYSFWIFTGGVLIYSSFVNFVGALGGTMNCSLEKFTFFEHLNRHDLYKMDYLPLFSGIFIFFSIYFIFLCLRRNKKFVLLIITSCTDYLATYRLTKVPKFMFVRKTLRKTHQSHYHSKIPSAKSKKAD